jgi:asparagine synthase (glutamine-hydrolysing)
MCGIAGFWVKDKTQVKQKTLVEKMTQTLYHRGPDGYGYHADEDAGLAMGHARLSIIDLETGNQPLYNRDRQKVLTVNGEFYDYKRIRAGLICDGVAFNTKSDSEIALYLYERKGLDFTEDLRGEFAFALFDASERRLILGRDRFGIKPLFYYLDERKGIYWGSELKAILAHPDVPKELSAKATLHQLMHTMIPGMTAFDKIKALKPGHLLIFENKNGAFTAREIKYWDFDFPRHEERGEPASPAVYIERVQTELLEAVQHRLEADVPVGCYLSGGIDSCSMLGLASAVQQSPVKAFTISFDHSDYDESHIATEMAEKVNADQELLNLTHNDLYGDNFRRTVWHSERTFYNTLGVAKWCMSRRVRDCGYKVVVTGEGSDELFGGYPFFKRDMLRLGLTSDPEKAKQLQLQMEKSNRLFRGAILSENRMSHPAFEALCGFTPAWLQPWMQTLEIARPLLNGDVLAALDGYDPIAAIAECFDSTYIDGRHVLDIAQYTWSKTMLECQILNWGGDRVDMANSMESRPAFLDHHVAQAATEIPPELRIKDGVEKWVLREAMKNILPEVLYKREKFAFMAPPAHTQKKKQVAIKELIHSYLSPPAVQDAGILDEGRIRAFIRDYESDADNTSLVRKDALLNHLLSIQILHKQFIQGEAVP